MIDASNREARNQIALYTASLLYLGGTSQNYGFGIALDSNGFIYVTGTTDSSDFPVTASAYQSSLAPGAFNGFVSKLSSDGSSLLYSSYLGGSGQDFFYALAVDGKQNAYLTGTTTSTNFPTTANALQNALLSPSGGDAFLARIDTTQSGTNSLVYSASSRFGYCISLLNQIGLCFNNEHAY